MAYEENEKVCEKRLGLNPQNFIPEWCTAKSLDEILTVVERNHARRRVTIIKDDSGRGGTAVPVFSRNDAIERLRSHRRVDDSGKLYNKRGRPVDHVLIEVGLDRKGEHRAGAGPWPIELVPLMVLDSNGAYRPVSIGYRIGIRTFKSKCVECKCTRHASRRMATGVEFKYGAVWNYAT